MVCSFCAQGVTRNLSKLPFIDRSKYIKGVKVEIEKQKVTIAVKPENTLDLSQVFKSILKGGYEPVEAYVSDSNGNITVHKADGA
jgi:copper chaperone CopZ